MQCKVHCLIICDSIIRSESGLFENYMYTYSVFNEICLALDASDGLNVINTNCKLMYILASFDRDIYIINPGILPYSHFQIILFSDQQFLNQFCVCFLAALGYEHSVFTNEINAGKCTKV